MIVSILNESVAYKIRCIDYLNQTVRQRLFFSVSWSLTHDCCCTVVICMPLILASVLIPISFSFQFDLSNEEVHAVSNDNIQYAVSIQYKLYIAT